MNAIHPADDPYRPYDPYLDAAYRRAQETAEWARRRALSRSARGTATSGRASGSATRSGPRRFIGATTRLALSLEALMNLTARTRPSTPAAPQHR